MTGARVVAVGTYRASRLVTNDDLARRVETSDSWIRSRTGITTRRIADDEESVVTMAAAAGEKALATAGVAGEDVDLVILATCSNRSQIPSGSPQVAERVGAKRAGTFDLNAGCAGFCYSLSVAADVIRSGNARHVLVTASEKLSDYTDWDDRATCVLLADGAGAALVSSSETDEIGPVVWGHEGSRHELIKVAGHGDDFFRMQGQKVFRWAITLIPTVRMVCERAGLDPSELVGIVPHQANLRIVEAIATGLGAAKAVVARDVVEAGNTSAASIPLAMSALMDSGSLRRGDPVLIFGFGAGLTYCGQVIRCP